MKVYTIFILLIVFLNGCGNCEKAQFNLKEQALFLDIGREIKFSNGTDTISMIPKGEVSISPKVSGGMRKCASTGEISYSKDLDFDRKISYSLKLMKGERFYYDYIINVHPGFRFEFEPDFTVSLVSNDLFTEVELLEVFSLNGSEIKNVYKVLNLRTYNGYAGHPVAVYFSVALGLLQVDFENESWKRVF